MLPSTISAEPVDHLPPTGYYYQGVAVFHRPEHWQNGAYNCIYTQLSGSCLLPDDFHELMLALAHAFGSGRIRSLDLAHGLSRGEAPPSERREPDVRKKDQILASIAGVEQRLGYITLWRR